MKLTNLVLIGGLAFVGLSMLSKTSSATQGAGFTTTGIPINRYDELTDVYGAANIIPTDNPLMVLVKEVGGGSHYVSSVKGSTDLQKLAARVSNALSIAAIDPTYANTLSYQDLMAKARAAGL